MKQKKNVKIRLVLSVLAMLVHSSTSYAMDENRSSIAIHKAPVKADKPLDIFFKESLEKRGVAIRTPKTVIALFTVYDLEAKEDMFKNKATDFLPSDKFIPGSFEYAERTMQTLAFENMSLEEKQAVKIYDYSIFIEDDSSKKVVFAGLYNISPPDNEGWSESRFILREQCRGKGLGEEIKKAIYDSIIKNSIDTYAKLIKYYEIGHPNALFVQRTNAPDRSDPNHPQQAKAYTENASVPFKGLQGWVHEDNIASIKLNEKCGWQKCGVKEEIDLKGNIKKHYLYRSPSQ